MCGRVANQKVSGEAEGEVNTQYWYGDGRYFVSIVLSLARKYSKYPLHLEWIKGWGPKLYDSLMYVAGPSR